jgi:ubiquinone/menaquinone biosynthesis C-methylase UbiE
MGLYNRYVLPHVIRMAMGNRELRPFRERVLARAAGRVLEIGIGSGVNLPLYGGGVREVVGLEPSPELLAMAERAAEHLTTTVSFISGSAEHMAIDRHSVDTVVMTWTLCSIADAPLALSEVRRVLKADGQLLFVEHGLAPEESVRRWQNRLTPVWKRIGGGCHLNRPIRSLIENAGFAISQLETGYMTGPRPMTFMYEGRAIPQPEGA